MADKGTTDQSLAVVELVLNDNRDFIVKHLDPEDVIDQLIQERIVGRSAAQQLQLSVTNRRSKNRIICDQITTAGPNALEKFCKILRNNKRQIFIAEGLEESIRLHTIAANGSVTKKKLSAIAVATKRVQARYLRQLPGCKTDWPKHCVTQYVKLALVDKEDITLSDHNLNEVTKLTLQGSIDKILKKKEPLNELIDIFHYKQKPCPRLILLMGAPGIGKTTLANEICVKWARDGFVANDFDLVVLIPLRSAQQKPVEEVVVKYIGGNEAYEQLKNTAGTKCLLILEGLDEIAIERQKTDDFLVSIIKECTLLEQATILITSRPHACEKLNVDRKIEIVGFGMKEIKEFVRISLANDSQSVDEFFKQLKEYPYIHSLCYIPMNLVMIVDIFQVNKKRLPSTLTELYKLFIAMIVQRQMVKSAEKSTVPVLPTNNKIFCKMFSGIPKNAAETLFALSKLAYRGFFDCYTEGGDYPNFGGRKQREPKVIFTVDDILQCGIEVTAEWDRCGLLTTTYVHQLPTDTATYNFAHLTIQEFMCALFISTMSDQEQQHVLNNHFDDYPNVFVFFCGITGLTSREASDFLYQRLSSCLASSVAIAVKCLFESKQASPPQSAAPFELYLNHKSLQQYDCLCISHVLSCYPVVHLSMGFCNVQDNGAELLGKHYCNFSFSSPGLHELHLNGNDFTKAGIGHVMKIVTKNFSSLQVLNVGSNPIGDDGISIVSDGLKHNTTLTTLRLNECELSAKGINDISEILKENHALQILNVGDNAIGDDGVMQLTEGLQCNVTLTELRLDECVLTLKGASNVRNFLRENRTLKILSINSNAFGDDGILLIIDGLRYNNTLTELWVEECEFSVQGAIYISKLLEVNPTLQALWIGFNNIGDNGIAAIAGTLDKSQIRKLDVRECGITDTGARLLAAALTINQNIELLYVEFNPITIGGAHVILQSAVNNESCQDIRINDEHKANTEIVKLTTILEARKQQKDVKNLSDAHKDTRKSSDTVA